MLPLARGIPRPPHVTLPPPCMIYDSGKSESPPEISTSLFPLLPCFSPRDSSSSVSPAIFTGLAAADEFQKCRLSNQPGEPGLSCRAVFVRVPQYHSGVSLLRRASNSILVYTNVVLKDTSISIRRAGSQQNPQR